MGASRQRRSLFRPTFRHGQRRCDRGTLHGRQFLRAGLFARRTTAHEAVRQAVRRDVIGSRTPGTSTRHGPPARQPEARWAIERTVAVAPPCALFGRMAKPDQAVAGIPATIEGGPKRFGPGVPAITMK